MKDKVSSCILIQTSAHTQKRISELATDGGLEELPNHWTSLHQIYLATLSSNWAEYIKFLDANIFKIVSLDVMKMCTC